MSFFVDGRSYARRLYLVDCCSGFLVAGRVAGDVVVGVGGVVGMAITRVSVGLSYIVGGASGATIS